MKGLTSNIVKTLTTATVIPISDNSGAKMVYVIGALRYKGTRAKYPKVGIGDIVIASVRKGKPDMIKKVVKALIVRQRKEFRRANGVRIFFEDNAAVLVSDDFLPIGTEIKGVVAREIAERFPKVAAISAGVV